MIIAHLGAETPQQHRPRGACSINRMPFGYEREPASTDRQRSSAVEVLGSTGRWFAGFELLGFDFDRRWFAIRSDRTGTVRRLPLDQWRAPRAWDKALPDGTRGASSAKQCHAVALVSEVELVWNKQPPGTPRPPWLREIFPLPEPNPADCQRHGEFTRAYTVDADGEIVRAFLVSDRTLNAYAERQRQRRGTCPTEAVETASLEAGKAAYPADPGLRERLGFGPHEAGPLS